MYKSQKYFMFGGLGATDVEMASFLTIWGNGAYKNQILPLYNNMKGFYKPNAQVSNWLANYNARLGAILGDTTSLVTKYNHAVLMVSEYPSALSAYNTYSAYRKNELIRINALVKTAYDAARANYVKYDSPILRDGFANVENRYNLIKSDISEIEALDNYNLLLDDIKAFSVIFNQYELDKAAREAQEKADKEQTEQAIYDAKKKEDEAKAYKEGTTTPVIKDVIIPSANDIINKVEQRQSGGFNWKLWLPVGAGSILLIAMLGMAFKPKKKVGLL